jgi:hypothetical protein
LRDTELWLSYIFVIPKEQHLHEICPEERRSWLTVCRTPAIARTGAVLPFSPGENERDAAKTVQCVCSQTMNLLEYDRKKPARVIKEVDAGKGWSSIIVPDDRTF